MREVTIYTDGACCGPSSRESPASIGAGIILRCEAFREEFAVPLGFGTSQQAELLAVHVALTMLLDRQELSVRVVTDSQYAYGVFSDLGWRPKHNMRMIHKTQALIRQFGQFQMQWVKGHATDNENCRADFLAAVACGRRTCPDIKLYRRAASG